ncbi:uncharacterized protein Nmag_4136 (plasmid) [Natrialba magadii ATCC 43099]|uniref:Uncharacterized protein n=1 Tax=Natrialba magadii (strain ATCC 43099 / DSM 3394 / CCM 3739 / CIP 104546 / IAM 13178 / JCM 8861 / NBRC 102185 / NCIMB 2190 / MS3) TaxID=547559 RepID=D3T246_NATMM|nr:ATP-binding protein [Natrialba magadii]ADD07655.1 uncharacterized protein Nmag_4136 [Natrialba magadii ATCC 43099]ELY27135.1 hypothetical protein C500_14895 [Natrialba magadii ATCC 43099]
MSTKPTETGAIENECGPETRHIAFVGDRGVGKTTVAALVASRLTERTDVRVIGEATQLVTDDAASTDDGLGIEWAVEDCPPNPEAIEARAEQVDTVFIVATPATLERVVTYERRARQHDVDCFLVVNRFHESARTQLRTFDGPALAEYVYDDEAISSAIDDSRVPELPEWTVEAILIEALQSERQDTECALEALDCGERSIVNVEVEERADADPLINTFEAAGYSAAYFECNCRCHTGHVLARHRLD